jgi:metal-dependent amidase/aminoacylase/carboxypeptidase family protein
MADLCAAAEALVREHAARDGLRFAIDYHEIFIASLNAPEAVAELRAALDAEGVGHDEAELPMRASEDFGLFGHSSRSAMLFLGAGTDRPALHNPDYDFPDDLIPIGTRIFSRAARNLVG